uniref:Uncharacterized protein n=1 Tax=Nelumbo nucifera TaxID=4432 RepID=A0A822YUK5_NELNU|nr:TPA_asm: hypothetical protein HUJ06_005881 [Nelumbo nucifera]
MENLIEREIQVAESCGLSFLGGGESGKRSFDMEPQKEREGEQQGSEEEDGWESNISLDEADEDFRVWKATSFLLTKLFDVAFKIFNGQSMVVVELLKRKLREKGKESKIIF